MRNTVDFGTFLHRCNTVAYAGGMSMLRWKRTVIAMLVFGTAFGYLEAAVVTYLRLLYEPARQKISSGATEPRPLSLAHVRAIACVGHGPAAHRGC